MALTPGSVFAGYLIERRLGAGGMGSVYVARHPRLPRRVALKVLGEGLGAQPEFRARFEREAELAARLDHPNVVSVYDRGVEGDELWIAMQFVDGMDVDQLVKRSRGGLPPERAVYIVREAAKGLDSAHRRGLLHRDVKPANILVAEDADGEDQVLVTDFGIARALDQTTALTSTGAMPATLPFASPEQIEGQALDHRSDIYSLGCTLYVMLTGLLPFPRESQVAVINAHLTEPPPRVTLQNPSWPVEMDEVIARAMAKDPAHRYSSCRQLASAAQAALSGSDGVDRPTVPALFDAGAASPQPSKPSNTAVVEPDSLVRSDPTLAAASGAEPAEPAGEAVTVTPVPPSTRNKRVLIIGGAVAALVIVAAVVGVFAFAGGKTQNTPSAASSSAAPATSTAAAVGPWRAYDFVAKTLPGLVPDNPSGTGYQGTTCKPINAQADPIDDLDTEVPIARILCLPRASGKFAYSMQCNRDRTPQSLANFTNEMTDVHDEAWSRASGSGRVVYGTKSNGYSYVIVLFDGPARNFCRVVANGDKGVTAPDVYAGWFPNAPL